MNRYKSKSPLQKFVLNLRIQIKIQKPFTEICAESQIPDKNRKPLTEICAESQNPMFVIGSSEDLTYGSDKNDEGFKVM